MPVRAAALQRYAEGNEKTSLGLGENHRNTRPIRDQYSKYTKNS